MIYVVSVILVCLVPSFSYTTISLRLDVARYWVVSKHAFEYYYSFTALLDPRCEVPELYIRPVSLLQTHQVLSLEMAAGDIHLTRKFE